MLNSQSPALTGGGYFFFSTKKNTIPILPKQILQKKIGVASQRQITSLSMSNIINHFYNPIQKTI